MTYVPLGMPRFSFVQSDAGEMLVIPARRNVFVMIFLTAWLGAWTIGGLTAIATLLVEFHPFIAFWSVGWALGWVLAGGVLFWMLTGKETVRRVGGDLEVGFSVLGIARRQLYRGTDIGNLTATPEVGAWQSRQFPPMPVLGRSRGAVRFSYGARTHSFGFGLDEAEASVILAWLRKGMPDA